MTTNTYLIRRGIIAEILNPDSDKAEIGSYESLETFLLRNGNASYEFYSPLPVRYAKGDSKNITVLTEEAPRFRTIHKDRSSVNYPMPWVVSIFKLSKTGSNWGLSDLKIGIRNSPIVDINKDEIFHLPLWNIFADKRVCFGDASFDVSNNPYVVMQNAIDTFWNSEFRNEAGPTKKQMFATATKWKNMSLETVCKQTFASPSSIKGLLA